MQEYFDNGYAFIDDFYPKEEIDHLEGILEKHKVFDYQFSTIHHHNLIHSVPAAKQMAASGKLSALAKNILGNNARPFYSIILDKTIHSNWELDWHQDLKIAVKKRIDTAGYYGWSDEAGIPHVIPPVKILKKLLSIRIHLDDCELSNGAIWAIPQSHKLGIIPEEKIKQVSKSTQYHICRAKAGAIMLMSPLLLHKSPLSNSGKSRRILQVEYRATELENGLEWFN